MTAFRPVAPFSLPTVSVQEAIESEEQNMKASRQGTMQKIDGKPVRVIDPNKKEQARKTA